MVNKILLFLPAQDVPGPVYPGLHVHVKLPGVFAHAALASQSLDPSVHSLSSVKCGKGTNCILYKLFLNNLQKIILYYIYIPLNKHPTVNY